MRHNRIKIAFVTAFNADDVRSISGSAYHISRLLQEYCGDVILVDNLRPNKITVQYLFRNLFSEFTWLFIFAKLKQYFWKLLGRNYHWERTVSFSKFYAKQITKKLAENRVDLVFAEKASIEIAHLEVNIPIVYESDATFKLMQDYYPYFSRLSQNAVSMGHKLEQMALRNAALVILTSEWAARSAEKDYCIGRHKIRVVSFPVFFDDIPPADEVNRRRQDDVCELLFLGVQWDRKGGEIAVDALEQMKKIGVQTRLTVCGCSVPAHHRTNESIQGVGFLNKNDIDDKKRLHEIFLRSHFLILPTRAECVASAFLEANMYGIPVITTDVGGNSSVVFNGTNGFLIGLSGGGFDFAAIIKDTWQNKQKYQQMRLASRKIFEEKFSPSVWGFQMNNELQAVCHRSSGK